MQLRIDWERLIGKNVKLDLWPNGLDFLLLCTQTFHNLIGPNLDPGFLIG
jgi:hypothetical protein